MGNTPTDQRPGTSGHVVPGYEAKIIGDDGKEVFFHRSGLGANDYDALSEGDVVEYVVQEGPRGPRAENVRHVGEDAAASTTA